MSRHRELREMMVGKRCEARACLEGRNEGWRTTCVWRGGRETIGVQDLSVIPLERGVEEDAHFSKLLAAPEAVSLKR